ncbi:MAG: hypothetical protein GKR97_11810 [Rhizobiaceae bacterium]|nr:hypothetical protein [Rhizobiaceae bacterium]
MEQLKTVWLVGCCLLLLCALTDISAKAGPIARELFERGDNVGVPKTRPPRGIPKSGQTEDKTEVENRLDTAPVTQQTSQTPNQNRSKTTPLSKQTEIEVDSDTQPSACLRELKKIARAERTTSPANNDRECMVPDPVILLQTNSRLPIRFATGLTLDCPFALSLVRFANDTAQALARHHLGSTIETIQSGEGFVCRRRNNAATGKLSEHAFGNATDWTGFLFTDGSRLSIRDTAQLDSDEGSFLNSLRSAACGTFKTVLGPGSNDAHASHFHFDLGRAKDRKNPYRICE